MEFNREFAMITGQTEKRRIEKKMEFNREFAMITGQKDKRRIALRHIRY